MASLRVPKKHHKGLEKFFRFSEEGFNIFMSGIADMEMTLNTKEVLEEAVSDIDDIPVNEVQSISSAIHSLTLAKATSETDSKEFISELVQAIGENSELASLINDVGIETIKSRLEMLFRIAPLSIAAKANSIMYEYENIYYKSRAVTDVRPVFSIDIDTIEAALIIHNLRIHYHKSGAHQDFYVALDTEDLQQLIDVLNRAKIKAEKLKGMLAASNTPHLESVQK